jgi:hypothetical protein
MQHGQVFEPKTTGPAGSACSPPPPACDPASATAASTPAAHRPTDTSKRSTRRSSTNAGAPPSRAYLCPRYTGLLRELDTYVHFYNHDRVHHGRLTRGRIPADIDYGARKTEPR